tara:strand:+ start:755 stop:3175 length:2421 start_codon:yes stop_codon:yes gene_type:complete
MNATGSRPLHAILHHLFGFVIRHKWFTSALIVAVVLLFGYQLTKLTFDNTPDGFFMEGDPALQHYEAFKNQFQSDEFSLILLEAPPVWDRKLIEAIKATVDSIEAVAHVTRVVSITNINHIEAQDDEIVIDSLFRDASDKTDYQQIRQKILSHPRYPGLYISKDGRHIAILVETEIIKNELDYKIALTADLRQILTQGGIADYHPRIVGAPILDADVRVIISQENGIFTAACFTLIMLGFWIVFRSAYAMLMAAAILATSVVVTFGMMSALGFPYTVLTPIVPTFLMSVGINALVFLLTGFCYARSRQESPLQALEDTYVEVGSISLLTMLTTSAALFAFSASDVKPVLHVGVIMGAGLMVMYVATMLWFPVFLGSGAQKKLKLGGAVLNQRVALLVKLGEWVIRYYKSIFIGFILICAVALVGLSRLETDFHYLGMFKESTDIHKDYRYVDDQLPASASIEIVIRGNDPNTIKRADVLHSMDRFSRHIEQHSELPVKVYSLADVVKELNQAFHENDPAFYRIPSDNSVIAQELFLFESSDQEEVKQLVDFQYKTARITIRVPNVPDSLYRTLITTIEQAKALYFEPDGQPQVATTAEDLARQLESAGLPELEVTSTGLVDLWVTIDDYLTQSQITSVSLAFAAVTIIMIGIFRSLVMGVVLGLLNLSVVILVLGLMGATGIPLDPYTVLIASIALGILDDDTMHFVKSVQEDMNAGTSMEQAIRNTYSRAGQAMFYTTAILVLSFSINIFSDIASLTKFGVLISLTLLLGLIVEFLITPTLILIFGSRLLNTHQADLPKVSVVKG